MNPSIKKARAPNSPSLPIGDHQIKDENDRHEADHCFSPSQQAFRKKATNKVRQANAARPERGRPAGIQFEASAKTS